jgi:hypothetical protein
LAIELKYNAQSEIFCFFWGERSFFWLTLSDAPVQNMEGVGFKGIASLFSSSAFSTEYYNLCLGHALMQQSQH